MLKGPGQLIGGKIILVICGLILFLTLLFVGSPTDRYHRISIDMKDKLRSIFTVESDYNHLINVNFTFKMLPLVCNASNHNLLVLVHSAPDHFNNRKVIRETWGQYDDDIRLLFLLGAVEDTTIQDKLEEESEVHQDLLQGNFIDTYHNLTYKHVMALKYGVYHCPKVPFILKVDDDIFVNVPTLKMFLKSYTCQYGKPNKIFCGILYEPPVLREGKWATSLEDYPETNYPNHCGGFAILYPQDVIYPLYIEAQRTKFFWVDDVFVSGICAKKSNISHVGIQNLALSNEEVHSIVDLSFTNISRPFLVGGIYSDENVIRSLWNYVINNKPKTIFDFLS